MIELTTPHSITENLQFKAKNDLITEILEQAQHYLKGSQLMELNRTLNECFDKYEIFVDNKLNADENFEETNKSILETFLNTKKIEGASPRTISYYKSTMVKLLEYINCPLADIETEQIREYLNYVQSINDCSNATLDNIRRVFSTFFNFCVDEGFIQLNPMRRIKKIKSDKKIKKAFTDLELEKLRDHLARMPEKTEYQKLLKLRDRALFELLLSSGIRIGECVQLNKNDLNMTTCSFKVFGKGAKERICYFSPKAKYYLEKLFDYKPKKKYAKHDNPALFLNYRTASRMGVNAIERRLREIGRETDIRVHPHKFRRTFATELIRKEVPIEQVKQMMGHTNIDTTMIYTVLDQEQIKMNHNRYAG